MTLQFAGRHVVVAGAGTAGRSAADFLIDQGARVTVADARPDPQGPVAPLLDRGARLVATADLVDPRGRLEPGPTVGGPGEPAVDLVVVSPGLRPTDPLLIAAAAAGVPVWGEVELAWHADRAGLAGPRRTWLVITGTNGKTTTTSMVEAMLRAAGRAAAACGNIGLPALDAMRTTERADILCVEMSSFQLHWAPSVRPDAGVVLNVAEDHLDWHGSFAGYAAAKAQALTGAIAVVGLDDETAAALPVADGARRVGFTLGEPVAGELGVADGHLVDHAFGAAPIPLAPATGIQPAGPPGVADALAAAALVRAIGVPATAVAEGLAGFRPAPHRGEVVAERDGIVFIDDSKATNPHAAASAIGAHRRVVLIAGGQLKGAAVDDLIASCADRLAGVVTIGVDRERIDDAISRHAPEVPNVTVFTGDDGGVTDSVVISGPPDTDPPAPDLPAATGRPDRDVMTRAVAWAWSLARRGPESADAVLLAPAAASLDMFAGYGDRGDAFAEAARTVLAGGSR